MQERTKSLHQTLRILTIPRTAQTNKERENKRQKKEKKMTGSPCVYDKPRPSFLWCLTINDYNINSAYCKTVWLHNENSVR